MSNIQHVRIYDDMFQVGFIESLRENIHNSPVKYSTMHSYIVNEPDFNWQVYDNEMFRVLNKVFISYMSDFPSLTANYTIDLKDTGFHVRHDLHTSSMSDISCINECDRLVNIIVMMDNKSVIELTHERVEIHGVEGRIVILPSQWMCEYSIKSNGILINTNMVYSK